MKHPIWHRSVCLVLTLVLMLCAAPVSANAFALIPLKGTDVTLDETVFQYTGEEIRPNVTVRVHGRLLTLDKDYRLEYADNIEVGTGKVIVTGIGTASHFFGYTGTVEVPFQITEKAPAFTLIELKGTDVWMDKTEFAYTGSPIEPEVTVTVEGRTLVKDQDYRVSYKNNVEPGTGTLTVSGIGTASTTVGYTGTVEIDFTITRTAEPEVTEPEATEPEVTEPETTEPEVTEPEVTEPEVTEPEVTEPEVTEPETTEPETTEPETTEPETTEPEETKPELVKYSIIKGNKATWYQESKKDLSFTTDGARAGFEGIRIDGKNLPEKYYNLSGKDNMVVTLKNSFLKQLSASKHTITILFEDGQADGTFRVAKGLDGTNPETSDNFRMGLWISVMGLSAVSAAALILLRKKVF